MITLLFPLLVHYDIWQNEIINNKFSIAVVRGCNSSEGDDQRAEQYYTYTVAALVIFKCTRNNYYTNVVIHKKKQAGNIYIYIYTLYLCFTMDIYRPAAQ